VAQKPDNTFYLLGKYIGLASLLPSGAIAGYLLAAFLENYIHWPGMKPGGILLGVIAGFVKLFQELLRDEKKDSKRAQ
jgi:MFS family permease